MATWDDAIPQDTRVAFPTGAGDIRQLRADIRAILNTMLANNAVPVPPATLANYDSQIPTGGAVVPAPLRADGAAIDLRGCTWRNPASVTDVADRATSATTFSPIGNPGAAEGTGAFVITFTPVSAQSLIEVRLQCMARVLSSSGSIEGFATRKGQIRIKNTTAAAVLAPGHSIAVNSLHVGGGNAGWYPVNLVCLTTGISGANRFEPQFAVGATQVTLDIRGDIEASHLSIVEHV